MKKTKNIEWIINNHIKNVSKNIGMEIELIYYDLRNIENIKELQDELLFHIEKDILKDINHFKLKGINICSKFYKVTLVMKTNPIGKNILVRLSLK